MTESVSALRTAGEGRVRRAWYRTMAAGRYAAPDAIVEPRRGGHDFALYALGVVETLSGTRRGRWYQAARAQRVRDATLNAKVRPAPGWDDVLTAEVNPVRLLLGGQDPQLLQRIERAASNLLDALEPGMVALSDVQWRACSCEADTPSPRVLSDLAVMQGELLTLMSHLRAMQVSALQAMTQVLEPGAPVPQGAAGGDA